MKEELITYQTRKLAEEKGFIRPDRSVSQSLLQRWLREVHGINIGLVFFKSVPRSETKYEYWEWRIHYTDQYGRGETYETALEAALQTALKLIV